LLFFILIKVRCFYFHLHLFLGVLTGAQHYIVINAVDKLIMVKDRRKADEVEAGDLTAQWKTLVESSEAMTKYWSVTTSKETIELRYSPPQGPYRHVVFKLRSSDHLPMSFSYDLAPDPNNEERGFDRVKVEYVEMQVNCALKDALFAEDRFIHLKPGGQLQGAPAYRDHTVKYVPAS
jgi:hypothetical protein